VVLTRKEVREVLSLIEGEQRLMVAMMYGCGLRVSGCLRLRIKDLDLEQNIVTVFKITFCSKGVENPPPFNSI